MIRGGRGGRGANRSFNREQLSALGVGGNDVLPVLVTQPPPLFPLLERHPIPLLTSLEMDYLLLLKQDLMDHMQLSPCYLKMPENKKSQPEQEIDKLVAQLPNAKEKYNWKLLPVELRPKVLAKRMKKKDMPQDVNVEEKLEVLEKMEESVKGETVNGKETEETMDAEIEEADDEDEEMDDGTDYVHNYFDNGEAYEDEDDNLDDGPIY
ncbi:DNA-directed RNA polymerase III subunit RPC7-like [Cylas formicarius]|uniref:DNA-directed RNA polymerase III subunit RPC7-like n=1 Tax=Cylas formicarius TaxID=197179 RepID=UPI0029586086|nr:DNA-directed RNA polymerase III subunit RPC7-like [Cylas formicarius]